jgi:release factor glutamine methyltransferase
MKLSQSISPTSRAPLSVLDICTGSGCIPLVLCHIWPKGSVKAYGIDISPQAIRLANDNALLCGIPVDPGRAKEENVFLPSIADIRDPAFVEALEPPFDIVTANPPYISRRDYERLPPCVKDHEDSRALLGDGEDAQDQMGLSFYHIIARIVSHWGFLKPDALVLLEVGDGQAGAVRHIMRREGGFRKVEIWKDAWGKARTVVVQNGATPILMPDNCKWKSPCCMATCKFPDLRICRIVDSSTTLDKSSPPLTFIDFKFDRINQEAVLALETNNPRRGLISSLRNQKDAILRGRP